MATRMLIDARHQEETRVAVLKGNRIEEFDFESADHKQIKGNIYLAKVTRVEPSLQAAFVDFGGNRHGFLAFGEIHPDYYQIPKEDRDALLAAEAEVAEEEQRLREDEEARGQMPGEEYDAEEESSEALAEEFAEDGLEEVDTSDKDDVATIEEGHVAGDSDDDDDGDNVNDEDDACPLDAGDGPDGCEVVEEPDLGSNGGGDMGEEMDMGGDMSGMEVEGPPPLRDSGVGCGCSSIRDEGRAGNFGLGLLLLGLLFGARSSRARRRWL